MKKQLLASLLLALPLFVFSQSTGFQSPSATTAPNGGWTNPTEAFASDDVYTTVPHQSGCRCPFLYLSWDNGVSYTSANLVGPFGTTDYTMTAGSSSDLWGHAWVPAEFANGTFVLKIANPSTLIEQGYTDFNLNVPAGAVVTGIEVSVEEHGDSNYTVEYIDVIQVNVHYTLSSGAADIAVSDINVYPNPASSVVNIENLQGTTHYIGLYDMSGRAVTEAPNITSDRYTLNVEDLPVGMYLLEIRQENGMLLTRRVVIE